jgi:REP element-mobilizing transposase RayT
MEGGKDLYKNRYRIKSARWEGWDYSQAGYYFITICTKNREMFFGDVINEKMILSRIGEIAVKYWLETPTGFNNVVLDEFIVMPNHVHGIIVIDNDDNTVETRHGTENVETRHGASLQDEFKNKFGPLMKNSLSSIINHFKGNVKRYCNKNNFEYFAWQERFYDRVIRNERELYDVRNYILNNPLKWFRDRNNSENLFM